MDRPHLFHRRRAIAPPEAAETNPGTNPGTSPGTSPETNPGTSPETSPGTSPPPSTTNPAPSTTSPPPSTTSAPPSTISAPPSTTPTSHRGRRIAIAALVVLVGAIGLFARDILRIRHDVNTGQGRLSHLQLAQLDSRQSIDASLGQADRELRAGADLTRDSLWLRLLAHAPKLGAQVKAARVLTASAARVGDIAYQAAVKARGQLDAPHSGPAARLYLIDMLRQDLAGVDQQLGQVPTTTHGHLAHSLAKAHAKLVAKLDQAHQQLADGLTITATLRAMLAGPRTYLVLAGNNAEMRSGGITTAAGLIHFEGGDLNTSPFVSSFDLFLPESKAAPVPADLQRLYGFLTPGQEWRTTNTSPNWPAVAQLYANMSANSPFGKVDGVLFVDVLTLRSVLGVIGPVTVNGIKYTADNIVPRVLYSNYLLYPTADQTNARRDVQSNVARAAFSALRGNGYSLPKLAHDLQLDAKGRHLLAWSPDPGEEAMWTKLGADGTIGPEDFMVSMQNLSASKLDLFITPVVTVTSQTYSDHKEVNLYVTVSNPRRPKTSAYIEGENLCCVFPGDQRFYLLFYLPGSAYNMVSYRPEFSTAGTDGGMNVVGMIDTVPYASTITIHMSFFLPTSQRTVTLVPASRVIPEQYIFNGLHATDAVPAKVPL